MGGGGGCGPTVEGFAAMPYMPYLCRICAVSVPYLPINQLISIFGTAWSIETIPIIRMPHMPYLLYSATDRAPIPHQNRCTEGGGGVCVWGWGLQKQPRDRLDGRRSRTASGSGPQ